MRTTAVVRSALSSLHKCMFCPITARSNCSALCKLLSLSNYFPTYLLPNSCSPQHLALTLDPRSGEHLLYQCPKRPIFHSYADAALRAIPAPGPFHQLPLAAQIPQASNHARSTLPCQKPTKMVGINGSCIGVRIASRYDRKNKNALINLKRIINRKRTACSTKTSTQSLPVSPKLQRHRDLLHRPRQALSQQESHHQHHQGSAPRDVPSLFRR